MLLLTGITLTIWVCKWTFPKVSARLKLNNQHLAHWMIFITYWDVEKCALMAVMNGCYACFVDSTAWSHWNPEGARGTAAGNRKKEGETAITTKVSWASRRKEAYWCSDRVVSRGTERSCGGGWCWMSDRCLLRQTSGPIVHSCQNWSRYLYTNIRRRGKNIFSSPVLHFF